jgi:hypothetical protein
MSDLPQPTKPIKTANSIKQPKVKKTVEDLLSDGQLTTGKAFLEQAAQKTQQQEAFLVAAQEEERMRSQKGRNSR